MLRCGAAAAPRRLASKLLINPIKKMRKPVYIVDSEAKSVEFVTNFDMWMTTLYHPARTSFGGGPSGAFAYAMHCRGAAAGTTAWREACVGSCPIVHTRIARRH
ncbi:hypothetical protein CBM2585_A130523 [Cupriavidus taiwanensis]|nr:hypothetical protein CBM2585_A130523 [Cupriavidus taiwanensis]